MPFPKLSPVLNNCPLHALTPEIKTEVLKYGAAPYDNGHNEGYQQLKNHFANFYGWDSTQFTWAHFAQILNAYNAFDTQIILGPVLRSLMKHYMNPSDEAISSLAIDEGMSVRDLILNYTELNSGRYGSLGPDVVSAYVASHLGIGIIYFRHGIPGKFINTTDITTIEMHHEGGVDGAQVGGHWERTGIASEIENIQKREDTQLNHLLPFLEDDPAINPFGIDYLKQHVGITFRALKDSINLNNELSELKLTTSQLEDYLFNIKVVPKALAKDLLKKPLTPGAINFIEKYQPVEVRANCDYELYLLANSTQKSKMIATFSSSELELIKRLSKYPQAIKEIEEQQLEQLRTIEAMFNQARSRSQVQAAVPLDTPVPSSSSSKDDICSIQPLLIATAPVTLSSHAIVSTSSASDNESPRVISTVTSHVISREQHAFNMHLAGLKTKVDFFEILKDVNDNYRDAYEAADTLWKDLTEEGKNYFAEEQTKTRFELFKNKCNKHIDTARPALETHRGTKELLGNIALAIIGLGFIYGIAIVANKLLNNRFLFFKTDSEEKIDELKEYFKLAAPTL